MLPRPWRQNQPEERIWVKTNSGEFELAKLPQILLSVIGGPLLAASPGLILGIAVKALLSLVFS